MEEDKKELSLSERCLELLNVRRQRIIDGKINCIPLPFKRFRDIFPGIEKGRYLLVTANQKIGKSKLSDFLFMYEPFFYSLEHPDQLRLKVLYFTLEVSKVDKMNEFYCHLLYRLSGGKIRISTNDLKSTNKDRPVDQSILDLLASEAYQVYIKKFMETVEFIDDIKNPTGINKHCRQYAEAHGKFHYVKRKVKDFNTGVIEEREVIDFYEPTDSEEIRTIILDNASNLTLESGMDIMGTINKMSKYNITLRDHLGYTPVLIQHQAQQQEGIENFKLGKLKPSAAGLAECKTTIRDVNIALSIYSPFKHDIKSYEGYDITEWKNNIRFMEIMEDRDNGGGGMICPLFFDGATSYFHELPLPNDIAGMTFAREVLRKTLTNKIFLMSYVFKDRRKKISSLKSVCIKYYVKLTNYLKKLNE